MCRETSSSAKELHTHHTARRVVEPGARYSRRLAESHREYNGMRQSGVAIHAFVWDLLRLSRRLWNRSDIGVFAQPAAARIAARVVMGATHFREPTTAITSTTSTFAPPALVSWTSAAVR
jgi:hypothetical protein